MNSKIWLVLCPILIGITFLSSAACKPQTPIMEQVIKSGDGAIFYQKNYKQFKYYIATIGFVSIDKVELDNGTLTAIYSYQLSNQTRHVVSELKIDKDGVYKGTCTTKVDGKILFAVNTWLTFAPDGTASGNWSWSGAPTNNDPTVEITKS